MVVSCLLDGLLGEATEACSIVGGIVPWLSTLSAFDQPVWLQGKKGPGQVYGAYHVKWNKGRRPR